MPFVSRIRSNIREGCDHELTTCTAIVGKNGSGKTTVIDAVALVTTGEARSSGLGKDARTLDVLKPDGAEKLEVRAQLSDGAVVDWELAGSKKAWRHSHGDEHLPVAAFHADAIQSMLLGDPKRIRQAIIDASGLSIPLHKITQSLPADDKSARRLVEILLEHRAKLTLDDSGVPLGSQEIDTELLAEALKTINKKRRELSKEVKELDRTKSMGAYPLMQDEVEELEKLEQAIQAEAYLPGSPQQAAERINAATQKKLATEEQLKNVMPFEESVVAGVLDQIESIENICKVQKDVYKQVEAAGLDRCNCVVCGAEGVALSDLATKHAEANTQLAALKDWVEVAQKHIKNRRSLTNALQGIEEELKRLHEIATQAHLSNGADRSRYETLRNRKNQAIAATAAIQRFPHAQAEKRVFDGLKDVLDQQLENSVHSAVSVIEKRINKFLPKNMRARISDDGQHIGVSKSTGPYVDYRALSGAQRAMTMVAFASATIPHNAPPIRLLVIDEVWLDSTTARALMKAVTTSVSSGGGFSQALICLVSWNGQAPAGWTLIQLDSKKSTKEVSKNNGAGETTQLAQEQPQ